MAEREHVVNIVDSKTGSVSSQTVRVQDHDVVGKLEDLLPDFELPFFIKNAVREIDQQDTFEEAFDKDDVVTVLLGAHDDEPERGGKTVRFEDCSKTTPIFIMKTLGSETPVFFDKTDQRELKFNKIRNWAKEVEIWRKTNEDIEGEPLYKGNLYKLPMDDKDVKYTIFDDNLQRLLSDGTRQEIAPCPVKEEKRLERLFYKKPKGNRFNVNFSNAGTNDLMIFTGPNDDFSECLVKGGAQVNITVRKRKNLFEFGVSYNISQWQEDKTALTCTFNASEFENMKMIQITYEDGQIKAVAVLTDTFTDLEQIGTKTYRESDRINQRWYKENVPAWIKTGCIGLGAVANTVEVFANLCG